jgi:hypothetical protein
MAKCYHTIKFASQTTALLPLDNTMITFSCLLGIPPETPFTPSYTSVLWKVISIL